MSFNLGLLCGRKESFNFVCLKNALIFSFDRGGGRCETAKGHYTGKKVIPIVNKYYESCKLKLQKAILIVAQVLNAFSMVILFGKFENHII